VFVTAAAMLRTDAADLPGNMAGRFRMSDALRRVDRLARTGPSGVSASVVVMVMVAIFASTLSLKALECSGIHAMRALVSGSAAWSGCFPVDVLHARVLLLTVQGRLGRRLP
jgi:hypothetical protein